MTETIQIYLPFAMSAITLWMTWLAGDKHPKAWAVGLAARVLRELSKIPPAQFEEVK